MPVFPNQCVESASFAQRYGPILDLVTGHITLAEYPAFSAIASSPPATIIEDGPEVILDTKRGRTAFKTESFTTGRLNFVVVFRRGLLSGRRLRLVA